MDKNDFDSFLDGRFFPRLLFVETQALRYQRAYKRLQWLTIVFSVVTSVLIGLEQFFDWVPIKLAALIVSVVAAGLAAIPKTFDYQGKWQRYSKLHADLEREYDMYVAGNGPYEEVHNRESHFVVEFSNIASSIGDTVPMTANQLRALRLRALERLRALKEQQASKRAGTRSAQVSPPSVSDSPKSRFEDDVDFEVVVWEEYSLPEMEPLQPAPPRYNEVPPESV